MYSSIYTGLLSFRDRKVCVPIDEHIFTPSMTTTSGENRRTLSFFVLTPEPTHSPFSNERQVTMSAANGKLNRIKIRRGAGGGGF